MIDGFIEIPKLEEIRRCNFNNYAINTDGIVINKYSGAPANTVLRNNKVFIIGDNKEYALDKLMLLIFDYRYDNSNLGVIHLDGNCTNNKLSNLVWKDFVRNDKLLMCHDVTNIKFPDKIANDEIWTNVLDIGWVKYHNLNSTGLFVSNYGRVFSTYSCSLKKLNTDTNGYHRVSIRKLDRKSNYNAVVHRIVMNSFDYNPNWNILDIDHINGIKSDNRLVNLRWCSHKENMHAAFKLGLINTYGEDNHMNVHSKEAVNYILDLYFSGSKPTRIAILLARKYDMESQYMEVRSSIVSSIIYCNSRLNDIIDYLVEHAYIPSLIFTPEEYSDILLACKDAKLPTDVTDKMCYIKGTPKYYLVYMCFTVLKDPTKSMWQDFITL